MPSTQYKSVSTSTLSPTDNRTRKEVLITPPAPEPGIRLESTFAHDQLTGFAKRSAKGEFIALVAPIFGYDLPAYTYLKLYEGLRNGLIPNAKIVVMSGGHFPAAFDNKSREIRVHRRAAERAATNDREAWQLLMVLMHEFGHYVDCVLRQDLADKAADGTPGVAADAPGDEGAKFAYQIAAFDFENTSEAIFADYAGPTYGGPLKVDYSVAQKAIRLAQDQEAQRKDGKKGSLEFFGAGRGEHAKEHPNESFGHESVEDTLKDSAPMYREFLKGDSLRKQIYFGNWLRDFSQICDPKIVRKPGDAKDLTRYMSREAWTKIIAVYAEAKFVADPSEKPIYLVTPAILGVYRPTEHIDNPTNNDPKAPDPQTVDPDFEPLPTAQYLAVDPATSMKRYIVASRAYMQGELDRAASLGPTPEGCRHFGAALHVLEDYFAHSNFIELSLRKIGYGKVLPWTSPAAGKHHYPVVTGMFASEDVIASTAGMIGDTFFKVKWEFEASIPGKRTMGDRVTLIVLGEHNDPTYLKSFEQYLQIRDAWASTPGHQYAEGAIHYTIGTIGNLYNFVFNSLLKLMGNSVSDEQVYLAGDPNTNGSTNPTHSQLAKDHDNHPFHTLGVLLAKKAVTEVGKVMAAHWNGDATANPGEVAASYFVHPFDCSWQDPFVTNWAHQHPAQVKTGESATKLEALHKAHEKEVQAAWDYLNRNYEEIFGAKDQTTKIAGPRK
ncbi:MAG: hypothetical protein H6R15_2653 [Proteobacteria bacterium]|nr:hypothetical protein [Pseudomonadota bacterium]